MYFFILRKKVWLEFQLYYMVYSTLILQLNYEGYAVVVSKKNKQEWPTKNHRKTVGKFRSWIDINHFLQFYHFRFSLLTIKGLSINPIISEGTNKFINNKILKKVAQFRTLSHKYRSKKQFIVLKHKMRMKHKKAMKEGISIIN